MIERLDPQRRGLGGKADSDHVRRQNRSLVLSALRRREPIARVDLGQETRLSPATITAITADLIAEGLIEARSDDVAEAGPREPARRGRPRVLLRLDPTAAYVLSVKISFNSLVFSIADFAGGSVARHEPEVFTFDQDRDSFPRMLADLISEFVAASGLDIRQIAEIAIGAQGFVDTVAGSVMWSPAFSVRDMRLVEPLKAALGRPCFISNDANMIAQALHEADPDVYRGTFAVIYVGQGVGAGLFVDDRLHHGSAGSAAEFGHMNHVMDGPLCRCGRRGCIEAFASDYAVYRDFKQYAADAAPGGIRPTSADLLAVETAAASGDPRAQAIYDRVGSALGYGVARLMALVNPSRIVFTGSSLRAFPLFEAAMKAAIDAALVEDLRRYTVIETLPWQEDMIMKGLLSYMLTRLDRDVFSNPGEARRFRV